MATRRFLARLGRRVRRPTLGRLVLASVVLHVLVLVLTNRLVDWTPPAPPPEPLIVELPAAEPGRPLVRPEAPAPVARPAPRAPVVARPAPPAAPPRPSSPPARPVAPLPEPEPVTPATPAPPPPAVARAPEPPPEPPAPPARAPEPAPALPAPRPAEPSPPSPLAREPAPPTVAAKPPVAETPAPVQPSPPEPTPGAPGTLGAPGEAPFGGASRFSLLRPRIEVPPLPALAAPGGGGTQKDGEGAGESGRHRDGQVPVPLDTPDPRFAEYFAEIKKRIEDHFVYPEEAARKRQSGQLVVEFAVKRDGTVHIDQVSTSGIAILDRYAVTAVRLAAPFPPIPDRIGMDTIRVTGRFVYILDRGFRIFSLQ